MLEVRAQLVTVGEFTTQTVIGSNMPNPPSVPILFPGSDTGISNSDGITNALAQIWNGSGGEPGATVTLFSSVDGQAGIGIVGDDGTWTVVTELTDAT
ncbi:MAG: Ig-like domain-containing protein, partial [Pseudomonadota bacterium]